MRTLLSCRGLRRMCRLRGDGNGPRPANIGGAPWEAFQPAITGNSPCCGSSASRATQAADLTITAGSGAVNWVASLRGRRVDPDPHHAGLCHWRRGLEHYQHPRAPNRVANDHAGPSEASRVADIFISYTSADRDWAFWIAKELEAMTQIVVSASTMANAWFGSIRMA
jgi:hypothetical protein